MVKATLPPDQNASPEEFPAVSPRDLHPTSDIRFVMVETGKLTTKVERLIDDVRVLGEQAVTHQQGAAVAATLTTDRLGKVESGLASLVAARSAPWWKRIDAANLVLAAIGILTLLLTLFLGNGRFEDISKRLDAADKHSDAVETRANRLDERISSKLDQIQIDLATIKAERAAAAKK